MREEILTWISRLCECADAPEAFRNEFVRKLKNSPAVYEEFEYYFDNERFLGKANIAGMTVVDIMIWQMDHFKSDLDRGLYDMQSNPDKMLLMAFDTMLNMEIAPNEYLTRYMGDTGTDYPGKY